MPCSAEVWADSVPSTVPSFFLLASSDRSDGALGPTVASLRSVVTAGGHDMETRLDSLVRDRSSLAALNLAGSSIGVTRRAEDRRRKR